MVGIFYLNHLTCCTLEVPTAEPIHKALPISRTQSVRINMEYSISGFSC